MGLVIVDAREQTFLDNYFTLVNIGGGHSLRLYTNDVTAGLTPDQIDQLTTGSFTVATFPGYANVTVSTAWTYVQGNPTVASNTLRSFTRTSTGTPQSIRGYFMVDVGSGALCWFEAFPAPIVMEFINDRIDITPRMSCDDVKGNPVEPGTITATGRTAAASGWLLCQGQAVSRSTFAPLFAAIGTTYGVGDGSTTFNVPNLQQRFPLGKATSGTGATLGGTGGLINHTHPLDTSSSFAKIAMNDSLDQISSETKAVSGWTRNAGASLVTNATGATDTLGAKLAGSTDIADPPFQVVNFQIKT